MQCLIFSAKSQLRSAQIFNLGAVLATLCMPLFPIFFVWIGISIFVYSANIQHPNPKVRRYTQYAGYRFYGVSGCLLASMIFSGVLLSWVGGGLSLLLLLWLVASSVVVPAGIWSIMKARREPWQEMQAEVPATSNPA